MGNSQGPSLSVGGRPAKLPGLPEDDFGAGSPMPCSAVPGADRQRPPLRAGPARTEAAAGPSHSVGPSSPRSPAPVPQVGGGGRPCRRGRGAREGREERRHTWSSAGHHSRSAPPGNRVETPGPELPARQPRADSDGGGGGGGPVGHQAGLLAALLKPLVANYPGGPPKRPPSRGKRSLFGDGLPWKPPMRTSFLFVAGS